MSLTFIDPLSENFAYLSPVIYCPSCAQLVFNTLPAAPHSSLLNSVARGCHGGQYFTAWPRQHKRLPTTVGKARPPPTSFPAARCQVHLDRGPGEDRMEQGPSGRLLFAFFRSTTPIPSSSSFSSSTVKRQLPAHHVHEAERKHL